MTALPPEAPIEPAADGDVHARSLLGLRASLLLLLALVLTTLVIFGAAVAGILFLPGGRELAVNVLAVTLFVHGAAMLAVLHWGLRRAGSGWRELGFHRPTSRMLHLFWQVPLIFLVVITVQGLVFTLSGEVPEDGGGVDAVLVGVGPGLTIIAIIGIAILTPIWEEAAFRGIIYGGLKRRLGLIAAALISATLFAVAHGVPILLPYMVTMGLAFVYLREFHRTLWAPIVMHASVNTLAALVALVALRG